jgi:hypothetical protein
VRSLTRHFNDAALVAVALAISVHAAFSAATLGDYPNDGGPALDALLHGHLQAFGRAHPSMGDLSLLVRVPFAGLAYLGRPSDINIYRWGTLPCVLSVAALALWLVRIARARGTGLIGQWAILLVALVNPLLSSAVELGHPEELMTAALCTAALIAALQSRPLLSVVLLGLALACKEWAVVAILPVLLTLDRARVRALLGALATAAIVTVPEVLGSPLSYLHNQVFLARGQGLAPSIWSWWWPFTPDHTTTVLSGGARLSLTYHRLPVLIAHSLHSLIIAVDVLAAATVARFRRLPLRRDDAFALMGVVMLMRCVLDTETMPYFHVALLFDLLAWDAVAGERLPWRALAGAAVSYVLFDRLTPEAVGAASASIAYGATSLIVLILLVRTLAARPARSARPIAVHVPVSG